ncbi:hypothetical protein PR048_032647 [Dryococelus australis]|uniref:Uncharacterized protein n=1 Tax=Dryococelus australis TaxID=614101 RepID=A0ABQ9G5N1_9NEOP|nr:hypothetical protein PR048_032647 [Dryococelus australis]
MHSGRPSVIQEDLGSDPGQAILSSVSHGFPKSLQANGGMVPYHRLEADSFTAIASLRQFGPPFMTSLSTRHLGLAHLAKGCSREVSMEHRRNVRTGEGEIPEKTRRAAALSGTIPTYENPGLQRESNPVRLDGRGDRISLERVAAASLTPVMHEEDDLARVIISTGQDPRHHSLCYMLQAAPQETSGLSRRPGSVFALVTNPKTASSTGWIFIIPLRASEASSISCIGCSRREQIVGSRTVETCSSKKNLLWSSVPVIIVSSLVRNFVFVSVFVCAVLVRHCTWPPVAAWSVSEPENCPGICSSVLRPSGDDVHATGKFTGARCLGKASVPEKLRFTMAAACAQASPCCGTPAERTTSLQHRRHESGGPCANRSSVPEPSRHLRKRTSRVLMLVSAAPYPDTNIVDVQSEARHSSGKDKATPLPTFRCTNGVTEGLCIWLTGFLGVLSFIPRPCALLLVYLKATGAWKQIDGRVAVTRKRTSAVALNAQVRPTPENGGLKTSRGARKLELAITTRWSRCHLPYTMRIPHEWPPLSLLRPFLGDPVVQLRAVLPPPSSSTPSSSTVRHDEGPPDIISYSHLTITRDSEISRIHLGNKLDSTINCALEPRLVVRWLIPQFHSFIADQVERYTILVLLQTTLTGHCRRSSFQLYHTPGFSVRPLLQTLTTGAHLGLYSSVSLAQKALRTTNHAEWDVEVTIRTFKQRLFQDVHSFQGNERQSPGLMPLKRCVSRARGAEKGKRCGAAASKLMHILRALPFLCDQLCIASRAMVSRSPIAQSASRILHCLILAVADFPSAAHFFSRLFFYRSELSHSATQPLSHSATQPLIHSSTPTQLTARSPAAIFIASAVTISKVQRALSRAERTSVIQSILQINAEMNTTRVNRMSSKICYSVGTLSVTDMLPPSLALLPLSYNYSLSSSSLARVAASDTSGTPLRVGVRPLSHVRSAIVLCNKQYGELVKIRNHEAGCCEHHQAKGCQAKLAAGRKLTMATVVVATARVRYPKQGWAVPRRRRAAREIFAARTARLAVRVRRQEIAAAETSQPAVVSALSLPGRPVRCIRDSNPEPLLLEAVNVYWVIHSGVWGRHVCASRQMPGGESGFRKATRRLLQWNTKRFLQGLVKMGRGNADSSYTIPENLQQRIAPSIKTRCLGPNTEAFQSAALTPPTHVQSDEANANVNLTKGRRIHNVPTRDLPFLPPLRSGAAPYAPRFTLIGSQYLYVKSSPNLSTPHNPGGMPSPLLSFQDSVGNSELSSASRQEFWCIEPVDHSQVQTYLRTHGLTYVDFVAPCPGNAALSIILLCSGGASIEDRQSGWGFRPAEIDPASDISVRYAGTSMYWGGLRRRWVKRNFDREGEGGRTLEVTAYALEAGRPWQSRRLVGCSSVTIKNDGSRQPQRALITPASLSWQV